ncbi:hypothetical protein H072_7878 [Dactylellina haptotyla CBS 200.50]|uniref:BZIP domain-containing protein n=1 Tax=Dactylellina haptotyla (strain CBS 200.50) TaxID=1284197 RepID=S8ABA9_DACHA|nr:hypothetical protein H072_7878 [Dactylellina haptotyla CBS 200.50]
MSSPSSSPELGLWDSIDGMNYDMLIKNMAMPISPPSTSDGESEATSPTPSNGDSQEGDDKKDDKKPVKKRKSWGQELPTPTTNLPPRKRAKTEAEKEQRRIERVLRNRAAAHSSRERKRAEQEALEKRKKEIEVENQEMKSRIATLDQEFSDLQKKYKQLEHNYLLAKSHLPDSSAFIPQSIPEEKTITSDNVAMADVQALSPQSLIQSPAHDTTSCNDVVPPGPAVSVEQQQGGSSIDVNILKSDVLSSETVDSLWTDWTLFDDSSLNMGTDPLGLNVLPSQATLPSNALPASTLSDPSSFLDISFDLFGLGKDDKHSGSMDLDLFGAIGGAGMKDL